MSANAAVLTQAIQNSLRKKNWWIPLALFPGLSYPNISSHQENIHYQHNIWMELGGDEFCLLASPANLAICQILLCFSTGILHGYRSMEDF